MNDLFGSMITTEPADDSSKPLADRLRPKSFKDICGQDHLTNKDGPFRAMCANQILSSVILWGPPGVGKTTLARLIPKNMKQVRFHEISAVSSGTADLKGIFKSAQDLHLKAKSSCCLWMKYTISIKCNRTCFYL